MIARTLAVGAVALTLASPVAPAVAAPAAHRPLTEAVTAAITDRLATARVPAAAYAVVEGDQVVTGGYGAGVTADTPFVLGSISKSFTALAVLQLVDRGAVRLDAPVTEHLPWFRTAGTGSVPTVRQLLDQTSGLPTSAGVADLQDTGRSLEERVRGIATVRPSSAPGERFQYCNLNFATLGLLVQEVSGRPFGDYLKSEVLRPLRMSHTYTSVDEARQAGLVRGTVPWFGLAVRREAASFPGALPDGYLVSTAEDMSHYLRMQLGDGTLWGKRVISADLLALMQRTATSTPAGAAAPHTDGYGLGLATGTAGGTPLVAHEGDVTGFHNDFGLLPERDTGLVVLTAQNSFLLDNAAAYTAGLAVLSGEEPATGAGGFWSRYLIVDGVAALVALLMLLRAVRLARGRARGCRRNSARRALLGIVGAVVVAAAATVGLVYGGGALVQGYPLDPRLLLTSAPEIAVVAGLLLAYPLVGSLLRTIGALRRGRQPGPAAPQPSAPQPARRSAPYAVTTSALIRSS
ncbi:serine hydrolase domain-containing protein [Micromonospora sp. DT228]|uniref:serine hydrolase domain-containing protein n=1 Tax=Micromonospora sp. DT228 TaxID=3393443 RepID=UPI003CF657F7